MHKLKLNCWVVVEENLAGTENQCLGVAQALGVEPDIKYISLNEPWKTFSPYLGFEGANSFTTALEPPWPDLVIASGRKSIAASRYIKRKSGGKCFTVQIQDPRISPKHFDLVAVPEHDPTRGNNVIVTKAAPNRITKKSLDKAKRDFSAFMELPSPRAAVMIGGASQAYNFTHDTMVKLCLKLNHIEDASFMISTSRRSGAENLQTLFEHIDKDKHFIWDGLEPNPYLGMLAWADYIIVTADSTSMLSEACTTGKPVYMFPLNKRKDKSLGRIDKLHENLKQSGAVRIFDGQLENWDYTPFNDAAKIAKAIKKRMNL